MELTIKFKIPGCGSTCPFYYYDDTERESCTLSGTIYNVETSTGTFYNNCKLKELVKEGGSEKVHYCEHKQFRDKPDKRQVIYITSYADTAGIIALTLITGRLFDDNRFWASLPEILERKREKSVEDRRLEGAFETKEEAVDLVKKVQAAENLNADIEGFKPTKFSTRVTKYEEV